MARTFKHSGELGDIIYAMPTVKAIGGGVLYLDTEGGASDPHIAATATRGRMRFNKQSFDVVAPLLRAQPYITDVREWAGETIDYNLDLFRPRLNYPNARFLNLAAAHLEAFGLDPTLIVEPWLTAPGPFKLPKSIIVNRSPRHHSMYHWWTGMAPQLEDTAIFIGHPKEHEIFEYTFDCKIEYLRTDDAMEIARVLLGAERLLGNQSFVMSVAIGLGVPFTQEVFPWAPNCLFPRANAKYLR